jgi:hypothetical protein
MLQLECLAGLVQPYHGGRAARLDGHAVTGD